MTGLLEKLAEMPPLYVLDENRQPVPMTDVLAWAKWCRDNDMRVARTRGKGWEISTVFLGVPMRYSQAVPVFFETALFVHGPHSVEILGRYATWEEAEREHARHAAEHLRHFGE